ncbi:hypothetical protein N656DRAFT_792124 [Canariomyces notabilis]|uniref:DUF985 domain-containing protein n=1 Tax=Canariomyces notabilis TaxID=2074819 RepID=A0AAN6QM28_9PEZI|nr:hypothetical protein N656DRAFT_792124 [Canariomyces arenarius]
MTQRTAQEVITQLNLIPNIEKGYYLETFRDTSNVTSTTTTPSGGASADGFSRWHRLLDAAEVWHYYAGAPLTLFLARDDGSPVREIVLGPDVFQGQRPQVVVPISATVAPGFELSGSEMAAEDWMPNA